MNFRKQGGRKTLTKQPKPMLQSTTLWDFPSQHYGDKAQGNQNYEGVTPSYVIWNVLQRYTKSGDKVVDPFCGSGTTLDVCEDLKRLGIGFDLNPTRDDISKSDARNIPLKDGSVQCVFMDPPYSTHIEYSDDPNCIGKLSADSDDYYKAMEKVIGESFRVLRDGGYLALYVSDSHVKDKPFMPIGFELFARICTIFDPVDVCAVVRHNAKLKRNHWHTSAMEGNFFLRGFNYLFIARKNVALTGNPNKHDKSGSLSQFVKNRKSGGFVTPDSLGEVLEQEKRRIKNKPSVQRKKSQPFKNKGNKKTNRRRG